MFLSEILNEQVKTTDVSLTPGLQAKFENLFDEIYNSIKEQLGGTATPKWLAGVMSQGRDFASLEKRISMIPAGPENEGKIKELKAKIIVRNALKSFFGFNDKYLPLKPKTWALFRNYLTDNVNDLTQKSTMTPKQTGYLVRDVASKEYGEWYDHLDQNSKLFVDNMESVDPKTFATFKRVLAFRNSKKKFIDILNNEKNSEFHDSLERMNILKDGRINSQQLDNFFKFMGTLTSPRLKDIINKNMVYSTKKHTHDRHLHNNEKLRDKGVEIEKRPENTPERRAQKATTRGDTLKSFMKR